MEGPAARPWPNVSDFVTLLTSGAAYGDGNRTALCSCEPDRGVPGGTAQKDHAMLTRDALKAVQDARRAGVLGRRAARFELKQRPVAQARAYHLHRGTEAPLEGGQDDRTSGKRRSALRIHVVVGDEVGR
jgi:hypothetical protein